MNYAAESGYRGGAWSGQISLKDWLSDAEYDWRQKLKPANLVIETDFTTKQIAQIKKYWGAAVRALRKRDVSYYEIVKRYPALTLMALVGHASLSYQEGKFWEDFWIDTGVPHDQDFEGVLRHSIDEILIKFSLARFPDTNSHQARSTSWCLPCMPVFRSTVSVICSAP